MCDKPCFLCTFVMLWSQLFVFYAPRVSRRFPCFSLSADAFPRCQEKTLYSLAEQEYQLFSVLIRPCVHTRRDECGETHKGRFEATVVTGHKNRNVFKINGIGTAVKIGVSDLLLRPQRLCQEVCTLPPRLTVIHCRLDRQDRRTASSESLSNSRHILVAPMALRQIQPV